MAQRQKDNIWLSSTEQAVGDWLGSRATNAEKAKLVRAFEKMSVPLQGPLQMVERPSSARMPSRSGAREPVEAPPAAPPARKPRATSAHPSRRSGTPSTPARPSSARPAQAKLQLDRQLTSYESAYCRQETDPEVYADILNNTKARFSLTAEEQFRSAWGESVSKGPASRELWKKQLQTTYNLNNAALQQTDANKLNERKKASAFFQWAAANQLYFKDLLEAHACGAISQFLQDASHQDRQDVLEVFRNLHCVAEPNGRYKISTSHIDYQARSKPGNSLEQQRRLEYQDNRRRIGKYKSTSEVMTKIDAELEQEREMKRDYQARAQRAKGSVEEEEEQVVEEAAGEEAAPQEPPPEAAAVQGPSGGGGKRSVPLSYKSELALAWPMATNATEAKTSYMGAHGSNIPELVQALKKAAQDKLTLNRRHELTPSFGAVQYLDESAVAAAEGSSRPESPSGLNGRVPQNYHFPIPKHFVEGLPLGPAETPPPTPMIHYDDRPPSRNSSIPSSVYKKLDKVFMDSSYRARQATIKKQQSKTKSTVPLGRQGMVLGQGWKTTYADNFNKARSRLPTPNNNRHKHTYY